MLTGPPLSPGWALADRCFSTASHASYGFAPERNNACSPTSSARCASPDHLAKTTPGLVQGIAQRLLALTLGILCNLLAGRPARALAAYDGR